MDTDWQYAAANYMKSHALRRLRHPHNIRTLAQAIVNALVKASFGVLQEQIERKDDMFSREQQQDYSRWKGEERVELEQHFPFIASDSGGTTPGEGPSETFYYHRNGRVFCVIQGEDKRIPSSKMLPTLAQRRLRRLLRIV
jgi:hypothetical protein